jgi:hypothetical protein
MVWGFSNTKRFRRGVLDFLSILSETSVNLTILTNIMIHIEVVILVHFRPNVTVPKFAVNFFFFFAVFQTFKAFLVSLYFISLINMILDDFRPNLTAPNFFGPY